MQVRYDDRVGWVAGRLLDPEPCHPTTCSPPALPWTITADAVGPILVGGSIGDLDYLTGYSWNREEPGAVDCLVGEAPGINGHLQADHGTVVDHLTVYGAGVARTEAGIRVGDTRNTLNATHGSRIVNVTEDGGGGVWVDLAGNGSAEMLAMFDDPGPSRPITGITLPAVLTEGACLWPAPEPRRRSGLAPGGYRRSPAAPTETSAPTPGTPRSETRRPSRRR